MNTSRKSKTKYAVLGMLSFSDKSAYEISQSIANSTAFFWSESDGQIYPILKKLCSDGLISFVVSAEKGARAKKIYQITGDGMDELIGWLQSQPTTFNIRNEFLLQLFFGHNLTPSENLEKIEEFRVQLKQQLKVFNSIEKRIKQNSQHPTYLLMSLSYGQHGLLAEISWCEQTIKQLNEIIKREQA